MIKINLLPKEIQEKGKGMEWVLLASVFMVFVLIIEWGYYLRQSGLYAKEIKKRARWSAQRDELKNRVNQVENLDRQKAMLNAKKNTVVLLLQGRLLYPKMMESFFETLPKDVWLTDMNLKEDASKNIIIEANSNSLTVDSIADWLQTLESRPERFSGVNLSAIDAKPTAISDGKQGTTYSFKMTFTFIPGA